MSASSAVRKAEVSKIAIAANDDLPTEDMITADEGIAAIEDAIRLSQKKGHPVVIRVLISPVTAAWLLGDNEMNRDISETKVNQYTDDMKSGRWIENGDGIAISKCLKLNNGQHRCLATMKSGITFYTNVTVGLERDARATNDIGLTRTISSLLAMEGVKNHTIVGPMTRLIIAWEVTKGLAKRAYRDNSSTRIRERVKNDADIAEAAIFVRSMKVPKGFLSKPQVGLFHFILKKHAPEAAEDFLRALVTGEEEGRGLLLSDPRQTMRERLMREHKDLNHANRMELVFKTWNAWREGRSVSQYKINGNIPELV